MPETDIEIPYFDADADLSLLYAAGPVPHQEYVEQLETNLLRAGAYAKSKVIEEEQATTSATAVLLGTQDKVGDIPVPDDPFELIVRYRADVQVIGGSLGQVSLRVTNESGEHYNLYTQTFSPSAVNHLVTTTSGLASSLSPGIRGAPIVVTSGDFHYSSFNDLGAVCDLDVTYQGDGSNQIRASRRELHLTLRTLEAV